MSEILIVVFTALMTILAAAVIAACTLWVLGFMLSAPVAALASGAHQHEDTPKVRKRDRRRFALHH